MERMQIVINIPKYTFDHIHKGGSTGAPLLIENAIKNGTPLPKGHGRLIDVSPYEEYFNAEISYDDGNHIHTKYTSSIPTIIEVDKDVE